MWIERASNPHEDGTGALGRSSAPFEGKPVGGRAARRASACGFSAILRCREVFGPAKHRPRGRVSGACEPFRAPGRAVRRARAATTRSCPTRGLPQLCPATLEAGN